MTRKHRGLVSLEGLLPLHSTVQLCQIRDMWVKFDTLLEHNTVCQLQTPRSLHQHSSPTYVCMLCLLG